MKILKIDDVYQKNKDKYGYYASLKKILEKSDNFKNIKNIVLNHFILFYEETIKCYLI